MKKKILILAIGLTPLFGACKKDSTGGGSGAAISDATVAKTAFLQINSLWLSTLKPALSKTPQTYSGTSLDGASGGQAVVNGSYATTRASSSSSSTSTSTLDVAITFHNYTVNGLTLDGVLYFSDYSNSRSACSSSGCAFANHTSVSYSSTDGSGNTQPAINIHFSTNGSNVADKILIKASKSDNLHWGIKVTNGSMQDFSFSY